ncbi:MAG: hypothetical protein QW727_03750 [Candidatus Pacearchaeota archaeon]
MADADEKVTDDWIVAEDLKNLKVRLKNFSNTKPARFAGNAGFTLLGSPIYVGREMERVGFASGRMVSNFVDRMISNMFIDNWSVLKPMRNNIARAYIAGVLQEQINELKNSISKKISALKLMEEMEKRKKEEREMSKEESIVREESES